MDNTIKSLLRHSNENLTKLAKLKKNPNAKGITELIGDLNYKKITVKPNNDTGENSLNTTKI